MDTMTEYKKLFDNLYEGKLIYHERVTMLCELVNYKLETDRFCLELKPIKQLNNEYELQSIMFHNFLSKPTFEISAPYTLGERTVLNDKKIGIAYCGFVIYADPLIVEKGSKMSESELSVYIEKLLGT